MSTEGDRRVTAQDIKKVQNLIEGCLKRYMKKKEIIDRLHNEASIPPQFTELVWQKLEDENRDFFALYNINLVVIEHIMSFNQLLEKQVEKMNEHFPTTILQDPFCDDSKASSSSVMRYLPEQRPDYMNGLTSSIINEVPSSNAGFPFSNANSFLHEQSAINDAAHVQTYFGELSQDINGQFYDSASTYGFSDPMSVHFSSTNCIDQFTSGVQESFDDFSLHPSETNYQDPARRE